MVCFDDTNESVAEIQRVAETKGLLDKGLILDLTHASGGFGSPSVIQLFANNAVRPTLGNLRVEDLKFIAGFLGRLRASVATRGDQVRDDPEIRYTNRVMSWIEEAIERGDSYTTEVPFKLKLPEVVGPFGKRLRGGTVLLLYPASGSQTDQLAATVCDNFETVGANSVGTTSGGYSNTWEIEGMMTMGGQEFPLEWNAGHTIRPNGEILEGNPPRARHWFPLTPDNCGHYFHGLIDLAEDLLARLSRFEGIRLQKPSKFEDSLQRSAPHPNFRMPQH